MKLLQQTIEKIEGLDQEMIEKAKARVDSLIKPPKSLGRLEDMAIQLAGITGKLYPEIDQKKRLLSWRAIMAFMKKG